MIALFGVLVVILGLQILITDLPSSWSNWLFVFGGCLVLSFGIWREWDERAEPTRGLTDSGLGPACFCGCGMSVASPGGERSNALGNSMNREFSFWIKVLAVRGRLPDTPQAEGNPRFIKDGWVHWRELRKQTHLGNPPERDLRKSVDRWQAFSQTAALNLEQDPIFAAMDFQGLPQTRPQEIEAWVERGEEPHWVPKVLGSKK